MPEDPKPFAWAAWFTPDQYEHLLNAIGQPDGVDRVFEYFDLVRRRVDVCRECSLTSGAVIRQTMAQTRAGHPGIDQADLLPITRGMLSAIFEELNSAAD